MLPYQPGITPLTSWLNAPLDETVTGQGFFGSSLGSEFGSNFVTTHSIPRHPIVSLAAFQHSMANGFNRLRASIRTEHAMARLPLLPHISHAIGNSRACSLIGPEETEGALPDSPHPLADHSYLANRELWDDYFLSGIAPQPRPAFAQEKDQKTVALEFFEGESSLPVTRYFPVVDSEGAGDLVSRFFEGGRPTAEAVAEVAAHLRVDGLFNVNSTSVEAWKAMLGALRDQQAVVRDEGGSESLVEAEGTTPVSGVFSPLDVVIEDNGAMDREQWSGRRILTDEQIEALAEAVVREVRKRGPFLNLADFVNRRVGRDKDLAQAGAIQSALDSDEVPINREQNRDREVQTAVAGRFAFPEAEQGAMHEGAPSMVSQADILTPIAPVLSARSDSFIIRAYGEAVDADGEVVATAYCEAVVERQRDYVDASEDPELRPDRLTRDVNRRFGRRFEMASFRWLHPGEI